MGSKDPAPPPDYGLTDEQLQDILVSQEGVAESQLALGMEQLSIGRDQLSWAKEQWGEQYALLKEVTDSQLKIADEQHEWATQDRERYQEVFQPIEDELIAEAKLYATESRQNLDAGRAVADVGTAFASQRQNAQRELEGYGIDPSQTRYAALGNTLRAQEAATKAGYANKARLTTEAIGKSFRTEAINLGKGYPGQINQAYAGAIGAGSAAVGNSNSTIGTSTSARAAAGQWYAGAGQNVAAAGSTYTNMADVVNSGYANQLSAWDKSVTHQQNANAQSMEMIGTVAGVAGAAMMFNEGGAIQAPATGVDGVDAKVADGEYIVPADVVRRKGTDFFDKLAMSTRKNAGLPERSPPTNVVSSSGEHKKLRPPPPQTALPAPSRG